LSRKEGFLDRWSRLKEAEEPPDVAAPDAPVADAAFVEATDVDERTDEEILAELGLPDPDDLTLGDDVAGFMSKAVPDRLRRRALRQLWRANPVLANLDGLVEYGEDYTDSAMVMENIQTLYQVGKGMFVEPEEPEEDSGDEGDIEEPPAEVAKTEETEELPQVDEVEDESIVVADGEPPLEVVDAADAPLQPTLRRMTFS